MPSQHDPGSAPVAWTLPATWYTDPDWPRHERERVFRPAWHLVAHSSQFPTPGSHLVTAIAGVPILVLRDGEGELRALHNVCRHRAGPLAVIAGDGARPPRLRCRYHGWTYGLDGKLLAAPDMPACPGFDPAAIRLPPAQLRVWRDLVFVSLTGELPAPDTMFAGLDRRLDGLASGQFRFHASVGYEIACNWKIYVDNYLEGYHVPHIHPALNRMLDYRSYVTETDAWHSLQHSPLENAEGPWGRGEALYVYLWPNATLNLLPDRLQVNRVMPLAPDRCRVEFDYLYPDGDAAAVAGRYRDDHALSDLVQEEDVAICEAVQRGLASGSYDRGPLNPRREQGVRHFQDLLRRACGDPAPQR